MIQRTFQRSLNGWSGVSPGPYSGWKTIAFPDSLARRRVVPTLTVERIQIVEVASQSTTDSTIDTSHDPSGAGGVGTHTNARSQRFTASRVPTCLGSS